MVPVVTQIALENRNTFAVAKLNNDENRETIRKYQVRGQPIYMVFQDGKVVGRFVGAMPKARLLQNILNAINK